MIDKLEESRAERALTQGHLTNADWLSRFCGVYADCCIRDHDPAFGRVFEKGCGSSLWDVDGNRWIDLTCGFSSTNFGHAYEPLVRAASEQLRTLTHVTGDPHVLGIEFAERLLEKCCVPGVPSKVVLNTSGARAVETALKAVRSYRPGKVLCLSPGFHGRSIATSAVSDTPRSTLSRAMESQVIRWAGTEYPYCLRCPLGLTFPDCALKCFDQLRQFIEQQHRQISCVLLEPALGARGYVFPPADYFHCLRATTERFGIPMIADEIQTGLGRCGDWLLSRKQGWAPDLVVLGKSLGGGITPVSAVVGRAEVLNAIPKGVESETYAGNPLACAVGLAALDLMVAESLIESGIQIGRQIREALHAAFIDQARGRGIYVDGIGASCVVEFRSESPDAEGDAQRASRFALACLNHRLRVQLSGPCRTRVVMLPPLTMSFEELAITRQALREAVHEWESVQT